MTSGSGSVSGTVRPAADERTTAETGPDGHRGFLS